MPPRVDTAAAKAARTVDREVAPIWHDRFARLIYRDLPDTPLVAADLHCGPGRTTENLLQRLHPESKVLAVEPDAHLRSLAAARVAPFGQRAWVTDGSLAELDATPDDAYGLTICNLTLGDTHDWSAALQELLRVTAPGGEVRATLPLRTTWSNAEDILREALRETALDRHIARIDRIAKHRPTPEALRDGMVALGLTEQDFIVEHERFELLFPSGREFLFAPVVEHGPLTVWRALIEEQELHQELFWHFKQSVDEYYANRVFAVRCLAGLIRVRKPDGSNTHWADQHWERYPHLHRLWSGPTMAEDGDENSMEIDIVEDAGDDESALFAQAFDTAFSSVIGSEQSQPRPEENHAEPATTSEETDTHADAAGSATARDGQEQRE